MAWFQTGLSNGLGYNARNQQSQDAEVATCEFKIPCPGNADDASTSPRGATDVVFASLVEYLSQESLSQLHLAIYRVLHNAPDPGLLENDMGQVKAQQRSLEMDCLVLGERNNQQISHRNSKVKAGHRVRPNH